MASFRLEYSQGEGSRTFHFDGDSISVGRDKSSDFVLDHPTVSRQHAVFVYRDGGFWLVVVSRGGLTAVDGRQVDDEVALHDQSRLYFGELEFSFRSDDVRRQDAVEPVDQPVDQPADGPAQMGPQMGTVAAGLGEPSSAVRSERGPRGAAPSDAVATVSDSGTSGDAAVKPNSGDADAPGQIPSWDDIASSPEALEDDDDDDEQGDDLDNFQQRLNQQVSRDDDQTNPVVVGVAGVAIVGLVWFTFFNDPAPGPSPNAPADVPLQEQTPVTIDADCMGKAACLQQARSAYKIGIDTLAKRDAAVPNLFVGYKKLLTAQTLLRKAGRDKSPADMSELAAKKKQAREELNRIFGNYRLQYHQGESQTQPRKMAQALETIKAYFPDDSAREHRWAVKKTSKMKENGTYPNHIFP